MNEVGGMDLTERAHPHSPSSTLSKQHSELDSHSTDTNGSPQEVKSSCAIVKTDSNEGALILIENNECENSKINSTSEASVDTNVESFDKRDNLSNNHSEAEKIGDNTGCDKSPECNKNWKYRICPTSVDDQLENSGTELQLLSHCPNHSTACSTVKKYPKSKDSELNKNEVRVSPAYFEFNSEKEEQSKPISLVQVSCNSKSYSLYHTKTKNDTCLSPQSDNQSENFKLGETAAENSEGDVERSDGSDSGLGSEIVDERADSSAVSDTRTEKTSEIDAGISCESESVQDDQGTTEIDVSERCDGSDSGLGSELAEDRNDSETCQLENSNVTTQLNLDTDSCLDVDDEKADFQIEAPALDDLKTPSFEEVPCLNFEEIKDSSEPLRTPQPNLDFPGCSNLEKSSETKTGPEVLSSYSSRLVPTKSSLKRKSEEEDEGVVKKKRNISFNAVSVYYFPRAQGFTCVPSQGGSTLGMSALHSHIQQFTLSEHASEQRRLHRLMLQRLRNERLQPPSDTEDSESEEEPTDDDEDELDLDSYYFLQVRIFDLI